MDEVIVGIDPSTSCVGVAGFTLQGRDDQYPRLIFRGHIKPPTKLPVIERLDEMSYRLKGILSQLAVSGPITRIFIEDSIVGKSIRSSLKVAWSAGYVLKTCAPTPRIMIDNSEVKKLITGSGAATKEEVRQAVCDLLGLEPEDVKFDEADAMATALCGILRERRNLEITTQDELTILTRKEAATWARVSLSTIDAWRKSGLLEDHQHVPHGLVRVTLAGLKRCLMARIQQPNR